MPVRMLTCSGRTLLRSSLRGRRQQVLNQRMYLPARSLVNIKNNRSNESESWRLGVFVTGAAMVSYATQYEETDCRASFHLNESYDVGCVLGEGAYGQVFRAHRRSDGINVALKAINRKYTNDSLFQREIKALKKLAEKGGHPHVCRMFDTHDDGDLYYVAMELIEGGELFEHLIQTGPFSEVRAAKYLRQFGEAINFMHKSGIVHADLKPENLMLSSWEDDVAQLKVVDFGCAISTERRKGRGGEESVSGTSAYWSPEMFHEFSIPTPESDMWATGCILYILLTGSHPFDPAGTATDDELEKLIQMVTVGSAGEKFLDAYVFDERIDGLSASAVSLMKGLLHPDPQKRMTGEDFRRHPWVQGMTASWKIMTDSDRKLEVFWQKRFRAEILKKYAEATGSLGTSLSEENLRHIFHSMDSNGDGSLDPFEVRVALRELGVEEEQISSMVASVDLDRSGDISFDEFRSIMRNKFDDGPGVTLGQRRMTARMESQLHIFRARLLKKFEAGCKEASISEENLRYIFHSLDKDGNGSLNLNEIRAVLRELGFKDEHITPIFYSLDLDGSGDVSFEEFRLIMRKGFGCELGSRSTKHGNKLHT